MCIHVQKLRNTDEIYPETQFRLFIKCLLMTLSAPTSVMNADQDNCENLCLSDKDSIAYAEEDARVFAKY